MDFIYLSTAFLIALTTAVSGAPTSSATKNRFASLDREIPPGLYSNAIRFPTLTKGLPPTGLYGDPPSASEHKYCKCKYFVRSSNPNIGLLPLDLAYVQWELTVGEGPKNCHRRCVSDPYPNGYLITRQIDGVNYFLKTCGFKQSITLMKLEGNKRVGKWSLTFSLPNRL